MGLIIFLFGILFGSFFNAVLYRIPIEMPIDKGRSICPKCKNTLKAIDLVPVFSYLFLRGKCRYCGEKISIRYPLIEFLTGVIFFLTYLYFDFSFLLIIYIPFFCMLLLTTILDLEHKIISIIILNVCSIFSLAGILINNYFNYGFQLIIILDHILGAFLGGVMYFIIYFVAKKIYKQEAFGEGDIYLMAAIGLVIGSRLTIFSSFLSFFVALFFILIFRLFGKKLSGKDEIPFGPYMCISAVIVIFFGNRMIDWYFNFMGL